MTQEYSSPIARQRMDDGRCPECGGLPHVHSNDYRFWIPRQCDLMERGVIERIEHHRSSNPMPPCADCGLHRDLHPHTTRPVCLTYRSPEILATNHP